MASYDGAKARIRYLLGIGDYRATPRTITASPHTTTIRSYDLHIGWVTRRGVAVYREKSTPTTNRHIQALKMVLEEEGFTSTGTDDFGWTYFTKG